MREPKTVFESTGLKLVSITRRYLLSAPLALLILCDPTHGPSFLRAVLSILHENPVEGVTLFHDNQSDDWGRYVYDDPSERPADEKVWYDLLTRDQKTIDDLVHYWRQFCLNWGVLTEDLKNLSQATASTTSDGSPLFHFRSK